MHGRLQGWLPFPDVHTSAQVRYVLFPFIRRVDLFPLISCPGEGHDLFHWPIRDVLFLSSWISTVDVLDRCPFCVGVCTGPCRVWAVHLASACPCSVSPRKEEQGGRHPQEGEPLALEYFPSLGTEGHPGVLFPVPQLILNREIHTLVYVALFLPVTNVYFL